MSNMFEGIIFQLGAIKTELEFSEYVHSKLKQHFSDVWKTDKMVFDDLISHVIEVRKNENEYKKHQDVISKINNFISSAENVLSAFKDYSFSDNSEQRIALNKMRCALISITEKEYK